MRGTDDTDAFIEARARQRGWYPHSPLMAPQSPTEREAVATASDWKTGPEAGTVAPALVFCGSRLPQPCCCTAGNPQVSPTLGI
jgi:hypothetical protein